MQTRTQSENWPRPFSGVGKYKSPDPLGAYLARGAGLLHDTWR